MNEERAKFKIKVPALIGYILLFAVLCLLFFFNHRRVLVILIVTMIFGLYPSWLLTRPGFVLPKFLLTMGSQTQNLGESNSFITRITSNTLYPFTRIEVRYVMYHSLEPEKKHRFIDYFSVFNASKEFSYETTFDYCGIYYLVAEEIRVYDTLGLTYMLLTGLDAHAIVLPERPDMTANEEKLSLNKEEENFSDPTKGFDVSEIKELREYRDGDKLSQVHWKLSTKSQELIVKEYQRQAGTCVVISCDASYTGLSDINDYYAFLYGFGCAMLKEEIYFELVFFNRELGTLERRNITNTYDFEQGIVAMYYNIQPVSLPELEEYYRENFGRSRLFVLSKDEPDPVMYRRIESYKVFGIYAEI